jgi:hypothetical protein
MKANPMCFSVTYEATWRMTVARLAREADAVLMDLRGFGPTNRGCIFELAQLIASVSLHRIVLLVDASTDVPFLEQTRQAAWRAMPGDSPTLVPARIGCMPCRRQLITAVHSTACWASFAKASGSAPNHEGVLRVRADTARSAGSWSHMG